MKTIEPPLIYDFKTLCFDATTPSQIIIGSYFSAILKEWENKIIELLSEKGFNFNSRQELKEFAEDRLILITSGDKRYLFLDKNIPVCSWYQTAEVNMMWDRAKLNYTWELIVGKQK